MCVCIFCYRDMLPSLFLTPSLTLSLSRVLSHPLSLSRPLSLSLSHSLYLSLSLSLMFSLSLSRVNRDYCYEDMLTCIARLPRIAALIYRNVFFEGKVLLVCVRGRCRVAMQSGEAG